MNIGSFHFYAICRQNKESTSGLEPLSCSLRVCGQWLLSVAGSCKSRMGNELPAPVLSTIAGHCVRVRVKLGSASRRLRGAGSFAHLRVDNAGYGDSSDITALLIDRSRETSTSSLPRPSARPRIIATARAFMNLLERSGYRPMKCTLAAVATAAVTATSMMKGAASRHV
jgi:hypothetical protein